jgi:hypothetical protein
MKLGKWYNIVYEAQGNKINFWLLPLKVDSSQQVAGGGHSVTVIKVPTGGLSTNIFSPEFISAYGKRKKKPIDIKVNYRTARNAIKAIF